MINLRHTQYSDCLHSQVLRFYYGTKKLVNVMSLGILKQFITEKGVTILKVTMMNGVNGCSDRSYDYGVYHDDGEG